MEKLTVGEFLAALRKEGGYTQQDVADKLNISDRTLSSWETGRTEPDLSSLTALADFYGLTVDHILRGERSEEAPDTSKALNYERKKRINKFKEKLHLYGGFAIVGGAVAAIAMMIGATAGFPLWLNIILGVGGVICAGVMSVLLFRHLNFATAGEGAITDPADEEARQTVLALRRKAGLFLMLLSLPFLACAFAVAIEFVIAPPSYFYYEEDAMEKCYIVGFTLDVVFGILLLFSGLVYNHVNNLKFGNAEQVLLSKRNAKLAAKTFGFGIVPFALLCAVYFIMFFTLTPKTETVFEAENWAQFRDYLQTYTVKEGSEQNVVDGIPAGEYVFSFPQIDGETQYQNDKLYDLGNGFWGVTKTNRFESYIFGYDDEQPYYTYTVSWNLYYSNDGQPDVENKKGYLRNCSYFYENIVQVRRVPEGHNETYW